MADDFSQRYGNLLTGGYDCVDRIVLNAYYPLGHNPGGFRTWWRRWHAGSDDELDNNHLMRLAGRFSRRVRGWARANQVPVIECRKGERKHRIAEDYLATHSVGTGVFLILIARAKVTVWDIHRSARGGVIGNIAKQQAFVNHYSFHIMDPEWGHIPIKMSGHPPFGAQVILRWARVRGLRRTRGRDRFCQGRQLLHRGRRPAGPGSGRRHLVAARDRRAPEPGL
jgi:hypothetical protein